MYSSTFAKGWVGMSACPLVVLACESLHVCTVCIWRCEHARFCVEVFYALYINFYSFIHSSVPLSLSRTDTRARLNMQISIITRKEKIKGEVCFQLCLMWDRMGL